jgi:hypothetical protein
MLKLLDPLVSAGLESCHRPIVSGAVEMWNSTFGQQAELQYPTDVQHALHRLRGIAQLELPGFPDISDDEVRDTVSVLVWFLVRLVKLDYLYWRVTLILFQLAPRDVNFIESLDSSFALGETSSNMSTPSKHRSLRSTPRLEVSRSTPKKRIIDSALASNRRKSAKRTLTPRLRHDNSQIQYAPIESSPLGSASMNSQLLTDRQREVRERQLNEAAVFSDLDSTSVISSRDKDTPVQRGIKQTFLQASLDEFSHSSPTPRRGSPLPQIDSDAIGPPSSPPVASKIDSPCLLNVKSTAASTDYGNDVWDVTLPPTADLAGDLYTPHITEAEERPSTPIRTRSSTRQHTPNTPGEVFFDAQSSPAAVSPSAAKAQTEAEQAKPALRSSTGTSKGPNALESSCDCTEDSSPQCEIDNRQRSPSSSLSDLDEDSIMRVIGEADELHRAALPSVADVSSSIEESPITDTQLALSAADLAKRRRRGRSSKKPREESSPTDTQLNLSTADSAKRRKRGRPSKKQRDEEQLVKGQTTQAEAASRAFDTSSVDIPETSPEHLGKRKRNSIALIPETPVVEPTSSVTHSTRRSSKRRRVVGSELEMTHTEDRGNKRDLEATEARELPSSQRGRSGK